VRIAQLLHSAGFFALRFPNHLSIYSLPVSNLLQLPSHMSSFRRLLTLAVLALFAVSLLRAGTATGITGLYFTGVTNTGSLLSTTPGVGTTDSHWSVGWADPGNYTGTYTGSAYVVNPTDGGWTANTSNAQWITAPGARTSATGGAGTANDGGSYLPGNGNSGSNMGVYLYVLAFNITGQVGDVIGSTVTNNMSISLTISADDQFKIWLNPAGNGTTPPSTAAVASANSSWTNSTPFTLANFTSGTTTNNSVFKIGTNYLVIEVDNTNSINGSSGATDRNPSGLLFYQSGSQFATIGGNGFTIIGGSSVPIPEAGVVIPAIGAVAALGLAGFRRRKSRD